MRSARPEKPIASSWWRDKAGNRAWASVRIAEVDAKRRQLLLSGSVDRKSSNTAICQIRWPVLAKLSSTSLPRVSTRRIGRSASVNTSTRNFPWSPGRDFSGTVSAVGESVKDIALGDTVFGVCEAGREGTYAEKLAAKAGIVALVYRTPFIHSCLPLSDSTEEVRTTQMWVKRYPACKLLTTIRPRANPSVTIIAPYVDVEIFGHKGLPSDPYMSRRSDRLSEHSGRLTSVAPAGCQPTLLHKESPPERASRSTYSACASPATGRGSRSPPQRHQPQDWPGINRLDGEVPMFLPWQRKPLTV